MKNEKTKKVNKIDAKKILKISLKALLIMYIFVLCSTIAINAKFNTAPDEAMKYDVCKFIFKYKALPHGGDELIREPNWGISYAFNPIISYMFSAVFMIITSWFTSDENIIFISSRFVSVFCMIAYTIMTMKISKKLFEGFYRGLFVVFVTLLPQIIFLASYLNTDFLALVSISVIVYSWILGIEKNWDWKSCIMLALGIGICAVSYYNAYGYILCSVIIYFASNFIKKTKLKEFFKKGIVIAIIACAIGGWWFVRNYILYDGDILGLKTSRQYSEKYAIDWLKPSNRKTMSNKGLSIKYMLFEAKWLDFTLKSFIGGFRNMDVWMSNGIYRLYGFALVLGILGAIASPIKELLNKLMNKKENKIEEQKTRKDEIKLDEKIIKKEKILFDIIMIICIIIPICLSLYYSYFNDFQPQGRYIMPMIIPLMYFVVKGYKFIFDSIIKEKAINPLLVFMIFLWSIMPIFILFKYIKPGMF